jgi:hypothetical protein
MCYTEYVQKNLTLTVDDDLLRAARKIALDRNTSVNHLVRDYLAELVTEKDRRRASVERLNSIFERHSVKIGPITWTREDLHER